MPFTQIAAYSENDITHKYTMWTNFKATKRSSRQYRQLETYKYFKGFEITEPYFSSIPSTNPQFVWNLHLFDMQRSYAWDQQKIRNRNS